MKRLIFIIIVVVCVFGIIGLVSWKFYFKSEDRIEIQLSRCVDGDTAWFIIDGKEEKVRFLGIDTPETVHPNGIVEDYGKEASDYTCGLLKSATKITIEYDANSSRYDKYDRVLGWIFVDDNNLSELLLAKGYAEVKYIYNDYQYIDDLCRVQEEAYQRKLGIWNTSNYVYKDNYCSQNSSWK